MAHGFRLLLLYLLQIGLSICASAMLFVVIQILRRFDVFHINFRTLLWPLLCCVLINTCLQMLRSIVPIIWIDWDMNALALASNHTGNCADLSSFPSPCCVFICIAGLLICMERLYATFNFAKYEHENFQPIISRLLALMCIPVALYTIFTLYFDVLPSFLHTSSYWSCRLQQIQINPLKTQWHLLFTLIFHCVFCLVHAVVLSVNKEKQEVYVKFHYSSLSHRFQIAENVKSVRLLLRIIPQFCAAFALLISHSFWLYLGQNNNGHANGTDDWEAKELTEWLLFSAESEMLIFPIFVIGISLTIIRTSNLFRNKARLIAMQLWHQFRHPSLTVFWWGDKTAGRSALKRNSVQLSNIINGYCTNCGGLAHGPGEKKAVCEARMLREYWDDFLHVQ